MTESKVPHQEEIVLATVQGKEVTSLPEDLYVPPNSLKIFFRYLRRSFRSFAIPDKEAKP